MSHRPTQSAGGGGGARNGAASMAPRPTFTHAATAPTTVNGLPVPPLLRTWHAFAVKSLRKRATTVTLNLMECSLAFDKSAGFGERHREFGLAHLAAIEGQSAEVAITFHTPQTAHSDGSVPSTLHVPTGLFDAEADDDAAVIEGVDQQAGWSALNGAPLTLNQQTQMAASINAPGPAGVGSATHVSVYKKTLAFGSHPEAVEFVDLVSSVRLTGAAVGVIGSQLASAGSVAAKQHGNPAVLLYLELDERRMGAIAVDVVRKGLQRVVEGEMGANAAAAAAAKSNGLHPLVAQLTRGMRSCTLSRFIILYGRLLTLFNTPSAAASLLNGQSVMGAFNTASSLHLKELPTDFVPVRTPVPPTLLHGEEVLEHQTRAWMMHSMSGNGASGAVLSVADSGGEGIGVAGGSSSGSASGNLSTTNGGSGVSPRVRGCFFLTNYRLIFVPYAQPNLDEVAAGGDTAAAAFSPAEHVELVLGALQRVEQLPRDESVSSFLLAFHAKDLLRSLYVGFDVSQGWVDSLAKVVPFAAFPPTRDQTRLFAFSHKDDSVSLAPHLDGWNILDPLAEYARVGLVDARGHEIPGRGFRLSYFNVDYVACASYPRVICVPSTVSDEELCQIAKYRSSGRLPAVVWRHPRTGASLSRCSQPLAGMRGKRCEADEKLIRAIRTLNPTNSSCLYLMDARPLKAAVGNAIMGKGVESASDYPGIAIRFMGIDNIHAIRGSHGKFTELVAGAAGGSPSGDYAKSAGGRGDGGNGDDSMYLSKLHASNWLGYIRLILASAVRICLMLSDAGVSVTVHCSDGWDRTSQLVSLVQLMLDPYARTRRGFANLVEQSWLAFGHQFALRHGHADDNYTHEQRAPIFLQWVDCVWQVWRQNPAAFEFTERYLLDLVEHVHSCRYGTFLFDNEKQRHAAHVHMKTVSLWTPLIDPALDHLYLNPLYAPATTEKAVYPNTQAKCMLVWEGNYMRFDPERPRPYPIPTATATRKAGGDKTSATEAKATDEAAGASAAASAEVERELARYKALKEKLRSMGINVAELETDSTTTAATTGNEPQEATANAASAAVALSGATAPSSSNSVAASPASSVLKGTDGAAAAAPAAATPSSLSVTPRRGTVSFHVRTPSSTVVGANSFTPSPAPSPSPKPVAGVSESDAATVTIVAEATDAMASPAKGAGAPVQASGSSSGVSIPASPTSATSHSTTPVHSNPAVGSPRSVPSMPVRAPPSRPVPSPSSAASTAAAAAATAAAVPSRSPASSTSHTTTAGGVRLHYASPSGATTPKAAAAPAPAAAATGVGSSSTPAS